MSKYPLHFVNSIDVQSVCDCLFQMYCDGKLLFCDHIFNGYGSARKDFKKQVMKSRHDAIQGYNLPKDFKFRYVLVK